MNMFARRPDPLASLVATLLISSSSAHAAWEAVPELTMFVESTDNVLVNSDIKESASRTALELGASLSNFTQRGELFIQPRLQTDYYTQSRHKDLETDDKYLDVRGRYSWIRTNLDFSSSYSNETTLRAEFAEAIPTDPDLEEPVDVDTGRLLLDDKREYFTNRLNVGIRMSQRTDLGVELRRSDVTYSREGVDRTFRTDFDNTMFALRLTRQNSARNRVSARVFFSEYSAVATANETDSVGLAGTFDRPLTQTWNLNLSAGVQRSDFRFRDPDTTQIVDNADTNATFGVGLRRRGETSVWNVNVTHSVDPNSGGHLVIRDQVRVFVDRQLKPRLESSLGVRWFSYDSLDEASTIRDREYLRFEAGFYYTLTRTLSLGFGAQVFKQKYEGEDSSTSKAMFVGFTYRGLSRRQ